MPISLSLPLTSASPVSSLFTTVLFTSNNLFREASVHCVNLISNRITAGIIRMVDPVIRLE